MPISPALHSGTHPFPSSFPLPLIHGNLPVLTRQTFIGITVAITGNVLISLALNLQKLAHKRIEIGRDPQGGKPPQRSARRRDLENGVSEGPSLDEYDEDLAGLNGPIMNTMRAPSPELQRIPSANSTGGGRQRSYGTYNMATLPPRSNARRSLLSRMFVNGSAHAQQVESPERASLLFVDDRPTNEDGPHSHHTKDEYNEPNESDYLKSKLWWLGFLLMNLGEMGNFISYAWAPASIVAPLGTFALVANCGFAPLLLGERFQKKDLFGIFVAIIGAVTVVLSTNASDIRFDPDMLINAIKQTPFIVYSCIYAVGALVLATLSEGSVGKSYVFVDIGLCALFGGFTVLSTKAISTLLTMEWVEMFSQWITYPTLAVLAGTGIGQIRYLNRALKRFDSKVVIPIQFVFFTLSAILGSAILYGDFKKAQFHQVVTFLYGCIATFSGVYIIAWEPTAESTAHDDDEDSESTDDRPAVNNDHIPVQKVAFTTVGRKRGSSLIRSSSPFLRHRQSLVSLLSLSPAQPLLLVHTPPRDAIDPFPQENGPQREGQAEPSRRNRAQSMYGEESRPLNSGSREGSVTGRRFRTIGSVDIARNHRQ